MPCLNCAAIATSLVEIVRCGAPLTWMLPRPSVSRSLRVDLELLGGRLQHHAARLPRRDDHGVADAMRAARGEGAHAVRAGVGVGGVDIARPRPARRASRRDLPRDRLHALAEIDRRERDRELAGRVGMHQRLARIAAQVHADRVVDRRPCRARDAAPFSASACRRRRRTAPRRAGVAAGAGAGWRRRRRGRRRPGALGGCGRGAAASAGCGGRS